MAFSNTSMWLLGCQHILSRNLSFGYNFDSSFIPVNRHGVQRFRNAFMLRHDISKELASRISYTNIQRHCKTNKNLDGMDHEISFKLTQRPEKKEDEILDLASILQPSKRETSININKRSCTVKYKHCKQLGSKVES